MNSLALGVMLARTRLGFRWFVTAFGAASILCALGVLIERRGSAGHAVDFALMSTSYGLVLPVFAFLFVRRLLPARADLSLGILARAGADRRQALFGLTLIASLTLAALGAFIGVLTLAVGRAELADIATTSWIGALGGLGYSAWFIAASTLGEKAQGRIFALLFDFLLGSMTGVFSLFAPRAHLRNLLGGDPPLALSQPSATLCLVGICGGLVCWALFRTAR